MKLYNRTKCPDELLESIIKKAAKHLRVKTTGKGYTSHYLGGGTVTWPPLTVIVNSSRKISGVAYEAGEYLLVKELNRGLRLQTGNPVIVIRMPDREPVSWWYTDARIDANKRLSDNEKATEKQRMAKWRIDYPLNRAEYFIDVMIHELAHVKQYQEKAKFKEHRTASGRQIKWAARPVEIDAEDRKDKILERTNWDDAILELAEYLESTWNRKANIN